MKPHQQRLHQFNHALRQQLNSRTAPPWLEELQLVGIDEHKIVFSGIDHAAYQYDLRRNHQSRLFSVLEEIFPEYAPFYEKHIAFAHCTKASGQKGSRQIEFEFPENPSSQHSHLGVVQDQEKARSALSSETSNIDKKDHSITSRKITRDSRKGFPHRDSSAGKHHDFQFSLNTFVAGERNQLASRACRAVTEMPGKAFNPFVIYGVIGAGKTHLLEGIGHELAGSHPSLRVVYVTAEDFLNEFIQCLREKEMARFRKNYRGADLFLLDDLDVLSGARQCQTELLHTLNSLRQRQAQIVITCMEAPGSITGLQEALSSRLESGLAIDVGIPDTSARIEILVRKAQEHGIPLSRELAEFIAVNISGSVGRLEGALIRLGVHASLMNEPLSVELARNNLRDMLCKHYESLDPVKHPDKDFEPGSVPEQVLSRVGAMFQVRPEHLCSRRRDQCTQKARQAAIYLLKETTPLSLSQIGRFLGRTHSTIHSSLGKVHLRMKEDPFFRRQLHQLREEFSPEKSASTSLMQKKQNHT